MKLRELLGTDKLVVTSLFAVGAQYIADFADDEYADDIIITWTSPRHPGILHHSHSEGGFNINGQWWFASSTARKFVGDDGKMRDGTRWIKAEELFRHPERWDLYQKMFTKKEIMEMVERADKEIDLPYDYLGIAGFGPSFDLCKIRLFITYLFRKVKHLFAWYCSRFTFYIFTKKIKKICPQGLTDWYNKNGWERVKSLTKTMVK